MTYREPSRRLSRTGGRAALAALVLGGLLLGVDSLGSSSVGGDQASVVAPDDAGGDTLRRAPGRLAEPTREPPIVGDHAGPSGEAGSGPGGGHAVADDETALANLDPALLDALRRAAHDAADDEVHLHVNSGWRSAEHQEQLLREAVEEYGSEEEAARWVATPETSAHVSGHAVDIGPSDAARWLSRHGSTYGLCQIYRNEPWHYELRPAAVDEGCPAMYADPTRDPRMRQ